MSHPIARTMSPKELLLHGPTSEAYYIREALVSESEWREWHHQQNDDERITTYPPRVRFWSSALSPILLAPQAWLIWRSWPIWWGEQPDIGTGGQIITSAGDLPPQLSLVLFFILLTTAAAVVYGLLHLIRVAFRAFSPHNFAGE